MKTLRIYIDTSVFGGCFDQEFVLWSKALLKNVEIGLFIPVVSEVVATEIGLAPEYVQRKYAEIISSKHEFLQIGTEEIELLNAYSKHNILSDNFRNDMLHIALATVAEVDILVSWNFQHIVRFDKIRAFNAVNLEMGYKPLQIYSPREVASL
jgi:predicted nucleic acid-binding protein